MKIQIGDCGMNFGRFVLLCLIALVEFASPCYADYVCTTNGYDFSYTLKDGCATITETAGGLFDGRELVVPAKLDGHPVTSIGMNSFALITNSYYSTKCGHAFVENGPTEIGRQAFHTDGTGWNIVCIPGSVTTFSGASCFRSIGKLYWTVSSETQTIYTNAFSNPPRSIRIVAICGVPNELHDKCSLWTEFNHYGRGRESHSAVYYKCKKQYFDAWVERGGLGQFRGYVADDYVYGEDAVVSFDTGSGDPVADRVYRQGSPYESLPTPTKLGYKFSAWRTIPYPEAGADKGFVVDGDEVVASPKETLYAEWTPLKPTWTVNGENVVYDGAAHGITISPKAPVDGVVVTYSETEEGPYTDVSPTLTEAGTKEIWYVLKAPDWAPLTNSATLKVMKLVSDATVSKALSRTTFTYSGAANRPSVKVKDTTLSPDLTVTAYAAGDVDGDGVLSEDDVTLIKRYNAYQKLSDENKEKFSSYNLTGDALTAADVNQDGQVNADDVTALQDMFACYELVEGTDYTVTYSDNIKAGTGHVTITGKGNYGGTVTLDFEIQKATIGEDVGFDDGLYSGVILGDTSKTWGNGINLSDYPAVTNICSYPEMATACQNDDGDDPDNSVYNRRWRTWVYWGEMYLAAGTYRLAASFDDAVYMKLDGNVLANKKGWTTVDFSNFTISETGWYPVEFRFHNDQERAGDSIAHGNYGWVERKNLAIQNITSNPTSTDTTADNFAIPGFDINGNFVSGTFRLPGSSAVTEVDATAVYDGEGHTVNTNALVAAKIGSDSFTVSYSLDGANGWQVEPFVYTNAGQYVFWYRLQNENYNDYVHQVQLTITPKPISDSTVAKSLTAESFVYDGTAKAPTVTITDESVFRWQFVAAYAAGDVNGDGVLAQDDADAIDQYVAYLELDDDMKPLFEEYALTGDALTAADYNGDGVVDAADVTALEASFVTLKEDVDYTVAYENNIEVGAAKVIVTGKENYGGTVTFDFEIEPLVSVKNLKVSQIAPMGLALDFEVEGAVANYALEVKAITQDGAVTNVAKTLSGDVGCSNGAHRVYWNTAKDGISIERERATVVGEYKLSLYCIIDLLGGANATAYAVTCLSEEPIGGFTNEVYKTTKLVLKRVDPGTFIMGEDQTNEAHRVTLTKPFYMGLFEVTQKQWELVTGTNVCSSTPYGKGDAYPVHYVSYDAIRGSSRGAKWPASDAVDASSFLGVLRKKTGLDFDLPTEAQWEYTCRAGTTTVFYTGDDEAALATAGWYLDNSDSTTHPVGEKTANAWGFYDMHGNVWEWCLDWYGTLGYGMNPKGVSSGLSRVLHGGSWYNVAVDCTSSRQGRFSPSSGDIFNNGFRLSRTLP